VEVIPLFAVRKFLPEALDSGDAALSGGHVKKAGPNLAASVRAKLLTFAKATGEEFQPVLVNYAVERLLFRVGESRHRDRLALKGAQLFRIWLNEMHRPIRDLDLLGAGSPELGEWLP
jgi:hypothetical protein